MKRIKVLYITGGDAYGSGKALCTILNLLKERVDALLIYSYKSDLIPILDQMGIKHKQISLAYNWFPNKPWKIKEYLDIIRNRLIWIKSIVQLCRVIYQFKPDIIHTNSGVFDIGLICSELFSIQHIWHIREYQDLDNNAHFIWSKKWFIKRTHSKINYNISITNGIKNYFNLNPCKVIYDGVKNEYDIKFIPNKQKYLLFVGNVCQHKGIESIIDAFIAINKKIPEYELLIVGEGREALFVKKLTDKVQASQCKNRIKFLGFRKDVDTLMQKATAIIIASYFEGFGLVTTEAMFNGCLVIGKNTAGTKEQFDNGLQLTGQEIGLRYETQSELCTQMIKATSINENIRNKIISNSQYVVSQLYTPQRSATEVLKLYRQLIHEK